MILGVFAVLGAGVGYALSSWLVMYTEPLYRASVSGVFLTSQESHLIARDYIEGTTPSVTFVVRALPDPRSAWRAGYLAEAYSMEHGVQFDISEQSLYKSLAQGHTRVDALSDLELITVTSWSEDADRLAAEAISKLRAIDAESFGSGVNPLVVVLQRADLPQWEAATDEINSELLRDVGRPYLSSSAPAPGFLTAASSLEKFIGSDRFAELSAENQNITKRVTTSGERSWNIEFEGGNLGHVDDSARALGDFFRQTQRSAGPSGIDGGVVLVESVTTGQPLRDASLFSPVITSTASGLFFGLALGWIVMGFLRRRSDQIGALNGSTPGLGAGRRG
jgi:hypothetical protein